MGNRTSQQNCPRSCSLGAGRTAVAIFRIHHTRHPDNVRRAGEQDITADWEWRRLTKLRPRSRAVSVRVARPWRSLLEDTCAILDNPECVVLGFEILGRLGVETILTKLRPRSQAALAQCRPWRSLPVPHLRHPDNGSSCWTRKLRPIGQWCNIRKFTPTLTSSLGTVAQPWRSHQENNTCASSFLGLVVLGARRLRPIG